MHKHKHQPASPHNGGNDSIPTKPAARFRCHRFPERVFGLGLRTRECLSPFATKRTNGGQASSCTSDSHSLILMSPSSNAAFHSVVLFSLLIVPLSTSRRACKKLRLVSVVGFYSPFSQWRTRGGSNHPPLKFRNFDKVELDCKLSGKCLLFLFQHPN